MDDMLIVSDNIGSTEVSETYRNRSFQSFGEPISGKSVVRQNENFLATRNDVPQKWPYNLSDYLKDYIGKIAILEYTFDNRCYRRRGRLQVVGTNFIGIQTSQNKSLFLLELSALKSIEI